MAKLTKSLFADQGGDFEEAAGDQRVFSAEEEYAPQSSSSAFDRLAAIATRTQGDVMPVLRQNVARGAGLEDDLEDAADLRGRPE